MIGRHHTGPGYGAAFASASNNQRQKSPRSLQPGISQEDASEERRQQESISRNGAQQSEISGAPEGVLLPGVDQLSLKERTQSSNAQNLQPGFDQNSQSANAQNLPRSDHSREGPKDQTLQPGLDQNAQSSNTQNSNQSNAQNLQPGFDQNAQSSNTQNYNQNNAQNLQPGFDQNSSSNNNQSPDAQNLQPGFDQTSPNFFRQQQEKLKNQYGDSKEIGHPQEGVLLPGVDQSGSKDEQKQPVQSM